VSCSTTSCGATQRVSDARRPSGASSPSARQVFTTQTLTCSACQVADARVCQTSIHAAQIYVGHTRPVSCARTHSSAWSSPAAHSGRPPTHLLNYSQNAPHALQPPSQHHQLSSRCIVYMSWLVTRDHSHVPAAAQFHTGGFCPSFIQPASPQQLHKPTLQQSG